MVADMTQESSYLIHNSIIFKLNYNQSKMECQIFIT